MPGKKKPGFLDRLKALGPIGAFLAAMLGKLKVLLVFIKPLLIFLKTGGTMLITIWLYSKLMGWGLAVGFVVCIFVHEMGHVLVSWLLGVPISAPFFIPFMGALIIQKRAARSMWEEALIGIGGPLGGTLAGLLCLLLGFVLQSKVVLFTAYLTFWINLFNLMPVWPLDGGRIVGAVSPRLWLIGIVALGAMFVTGYVRNPMILIILIMSVPRLWAGLRGQNMDSDRELPVLPWQRVTMGISYLALGGFLTLMMALSSPANMR